MSNDNAGEARKGFLDTVGGKAKELAGAVTNKDDLVQEGRLQQADARNRRDAADQEAVADAERDKAAGKLREAKRDDAEVKREAHTEAERRTQAVEDDASAQQSAADRAAHEHEAADRARAEEAADAQVASSQAESHQLNVAAADAESHANATQQRMDDEADDADRRAAELRAETGNGGTRS